MTGASFGRLRHRIRIEEQLRTPDGIGGAASVWTPVAEVWAEITPLAGREVSASGGIEGRVTHELRLRHRDGVTPAMRAVLGARVFEIRAVVDVGERRRFLRLLAEERTP